MIIIPEISTVLILVPRTGTGSLKRAVKAKYPQSMMLYRHMEVDGVPLGYDRYRRIGVVREPIERMWSMYKFLKTFGDAGIKPYWKHDQTYLDAMKAQAARPFEDWLLHNETVFTSPYDSANMGRYWPHYTVRHPLPENRKSQWIYLRPDLGTTYCRYGTGAIEGELGLDKMPVEDWHNATPKSDIPELSQEAFDYVENCFAWDRKAWYTLPDVKREWL